MAKRSKKRKSDGPAAQPRPQRRSTRIGQRPDVDSKRGGVHWLRLPHELVLRIFAQLSDERDMESCCCVCKWWCKAVRTESFWLDLCKSTWARPRPPPANSRGAMQSYVQRRSFELSTAALPGCLKECQLDLSPLDSSTAELEKETSLNKIFACAWAEDRVLLAGTKDNQIVRWHFNRDFSVKQREIMCMPDSAPQQANGTTSFTPKGGQHAIEFNRVFGGSDIAVGGNDPKNILVLDYPSMKPRLKLQGNQDWMFSCCWIDRDKLLSCSRDKTVRLWSTKTESNFEQPRGQLQERDPLVTREEHSDKIRDMKFNRHTNQIATMSTDGMVKLWDRQNLDVVSTLQIPHALDLACMACDDLGSDVLCLGSRYACCDNMILYRWAI